MDASHSGWTNDTGLENEGGEGVPVQRVKVEAAPMVEEAMRKIVGGIVGGAVN